MMCVWCASELRQSMIASRADLEAAQAARTELEAELSREQAW
jgi:hypothetical protein